MLKRNHKFEFLHHLAIGIFLLIKGYDKLTHNYFMIGFTIIIMGLLITVYFLYEMKRSGHNLKLKIFVHFSEGLALIFASYIFYMEGKTYLPYVTFFTAILFFAVIPLIIWKNKKKSL